MKLYFPHILVNERNRRLIMYLVSEMTQGFTDPQREQFDSAVETFEIGDKSELTITSYIDALLQKLSNQTARHPGTIPAVKRNLRLVKRKMEAMMASNINLRSRLRG